MRHTIAAELVGNVAQVVVEVGDQVGPADPLVIIESMKMEIPVLAYVAGLVAEVPVNAGDVVAEGDTIAVIQVG